LAFLISPPVATNVDILLTALEEKGLARKLAEPDLIALSGDTASFLAGGEYPVPSVQSSSGTSPVITVQYQQFGVQLSFVPTVLADGIINLKLTPSVSELDYKNGVLIAGTLIPGLSKREARTTIELRDGQSFAIAGLLQSDNTKDLSQVPWLGSMPVLGALFRRSWWKTHSHQFFLPTRRPVSSDCRQGCSTLYPEVH
jgi:pilus assembly protein CpaC